MDALFGVSMNSIMLVLVSLLAVALASVAYVAVRNRIFFMMGLRNIPRRTAQTVLIVLGLMLSTLIISAAFATGDTVDYSISNQAFTLLGHIDATLQSHATSSRASFAGSGLDVPADQYQKFQSALAHVKSPDIDGSLGVLFEQVPVVNPESGLSEPSVSMTGVDTGAMKSFPDVISANSGEVLNVDSLAPDQVYLNESAADALNARIGGHIRAFIDNEPHDFTVVDVVKDRVLTGANRDNNQEGMVTGLDTMHSLFGHDRISFIAISARGEVRDTLGLTDAVERDLKQIVSANGLALEPGDSKKDAVDTAESVGNFMATFFLLLGLFSVGAGVLLIIMIFVMLAAERKSEMGMARAVGTKRGHLVQTFLSEGMGYNIASAMVGAAFGIAVSIGMSYGMSAIFSTGDFKLTIHPHITLRTLIVSYSLGVVLTFATVTFSSWRVSYLNIVAAIRGTEEDRRSVRRRVVRWAWVVAGAVSVIAGIVGMMAVSPILVLGVAVGLWFLLRNGFAVPWPWILSIAGLVLGALLFKTGLDNDLAFPFALGLSLIVAGGARTLTLLKLPDRPVYTTAGLLLLVEWGLVAGGRLEFIFGTLEGDIEMFFLSGIAMVTASTYVLVYNADVILMAVSRAGDAFGTILPALKTAIAYPLANRFRTGMTLAMISLVVFALTMMSAMNLNFNKLFLSDDSRGGWDVVVEENPNNPISDLSSSLGQAGSSVPDSFRSEGSISMAKDPSATTVRQGSEGNFDDYPVIGMSAAFIDNSRIPLDHRATGFDSDAAVWQALSSRDDVAVIDAFATRSGAFRNHDFDFHVSGVGDREETFDPIALELRDPVSGRTKSVQLIGVISRGASNNFLGVHIPDATFRGTFGEPELSWHYIALKDPSESKGVAKEIESTLLSAGVQADSLKARAEENSALYRNFFYLMSGFMSLGLVVGIAAVGVIAFRTVVERRQHIGMLRAIGYKRSTVALSFLLETSFVTLLAIFSGVSLALWLSYFLITSDEFPKGATYHVPWLQITVFAVFTYLASLIMTLIPARQAASIPTAEALRYE